jgi:hypothetical protein
MRPSAMGIDLGLLSFVSVSEPAFQSISTDCMPPKLHFERGTKAMSAPVVGRKKLRLPLRQTAPASITGVTCSPETSALWTCPEKAESTNCGAMRCPMGNENRPTPEFRREAVRLALTSGRTMPGCNADCANCRQNGAGSAFDACTSCLNGRAGR